jgi:hypothetical protein
MPFIDKEQRRKRGVEGGGNYQVGGSSRVEVEVGDEHKLSHWKPSAVAVEGGPELSTGDV